MWYLYPELLAHLKIKVEENNYLVSSFDNKERKCLPEELIRQLLYIKLVKHYGYLEGKLKIEYPIQMGITKKRADIVVFNDDTQPYIIAETKVEITQDSKEQLKSYINITRASYGVLASPTEIKFYYALDGVLNEITDIPVFKSSLINQYKHEKSVLNNTEVDMLGFEALERISEKTSKVTIKGVSYVTNNSDLFKYEKVKKLALSKGLVLPLSIQDAHWHKIIETLFQNATELKNSAINDNSFNNLNENSENRFLNEWLAGNTDFPVQNILASFIYQAYQYWCIENGKESPVTNVAFGRAASIYKRMKRKRCSYAATSKKVTVYFVDNQPTTVINSIQFEKFQEILDAKMLKYQLKT